MGVEIEYVPVGAHPKYLRAADVILTMRTKPPNWIIWAGQYFKCRTDEFKCRLKQMWVTLFGGMYPSMVQERHMCDLTHAATVVGKSGILVEAQWLGTRYAHIQDYLDTEYYVIHIDDTSHDRHQMVQHAKKLASQNNTYGWLTLVSVGLSLLSFFKLHLSWGNSKICSGVASECLFKGKHYFPVPAAYMRPGNGEGGLARYFKVPNLHRPDLPNYEGE